MAQQAGKNYVDAEGQERKDLEDLYSSILVATNDDAKITISMEDLNSLIDTKVEQKIQSMNVGTVPAGTVISYMGNNVPEGYLTCDGTEYNISEYSNLAEQIKTEFGSYNYFGGDGTSTFAVPDLRGEFLRGTGTATRATGAGAYVGQHQDATDLPRMWIYPGTNNTISFRYDDGNLTANNEYAYHNADGLLQSKGTIKGLTINGTQVTSGLTNASFTVRPTNTSVLYCIKY